LGLPVQPLLAQQTIPLATPGEVFASPSHPTQSSRHTPFNPKRLWFKRFVNG